MELQIPVAAPINHRSARETRGNHQHEGRNHFYHQEIKSNNLSLCVVFYLEWGGGEDGNTPVVLTQRVALTRPMYARSPIGT